MICISLKKKKIKDIISSLKEAEKTTDVFEIWFDEVEMATDSMNKIFTQTKRPILYKVSKSPDWKIAEKCQYIDLDIASPRSIIEQVPRNCTLILSHHDFNETPSDSSLQSIAEKALKKGAQIVKIATTAKSLNDSLRMLAFLKSFTAKKNKAIFLCMGKEGILTRLTGHLFGNYLMYFSLSKSDKTADGQITVEEFKQITWLSR